MDDNRRVDDKTVILSSAGMRSLIATAIAGAENPPASLILLHLEREDAAKPGRLENLERQARHYGIQTTLTIPYPAVPSRLISGTNRWPNLESSCRARLLLHGIALTIELAANRLIWPVQCQSEHNQLATVAEQTVLGRHLIELDGLELMIETPLLDLVDKQIVELAGQLRAPVELAWSCIAQADLPCRSCIGCQRRSTAFQAAGMVDPQEATPRTPARV